MAFLKVDQDRENAKGMCRSIIDWAYSEYEKKESFTGVILCEGDVNSPDCTVYSAVFPDFCIVPVGGCTTVTRIFPELRKKLAYIGMYVFAIIDRDGLSKKEVRNLYKNSGVYTTKLPFIENIICAPETLRIVCKYLGLDYQETLNKIELELLKTLWQKLKETLPINLGIEKYEQILYLKIGASTRSKAIEKQVNKSSILYSFRDKIIVSIVCSHLGAVNDKKGYYELIRDITEDVRFHDEIAKVFSTFIPKFEEYDL